MYSYCDLSIIFVSIGKRILPPLSRCAVHLYIIQCCLCSSDILNECDSAPCRNGGNCTNNLGRFKCDCPKKFSGQQCEVCKSIISRHGDLRLFTIVYRNTSECESDYAKCSSENELLGCRIKN